jgi:phage terminase large subunit
MRAGKTYAILQRIIAVAEQSKGLTISVVSSTLPALRTGAIRDFKSILNETGHFVYFDVNKSTLTWTCRSTNSVIEFFGMDGKEGELKARGAARDILFVNEANRIPLETFKQLAMRTSKYIYVDYNPSARFWVHEHYQDRQDASFEIFTYRDNEQIPKNILGDILSHDRNSNWWRVYGDGLIGELEGNVFKGWEFIDNKDGLEVELIGYGLDFGFRPDPSAFVALYRGDNFYLIEELFEITGLISSQITDMVKDIAIDGYPIVCDNARPEIIAEMQMSGLSAFACIKEERIGKDKVGRMGQIERMSEQTFKAVGKSLERQYLSYAYHKNKDGTHDPVIKDGNDHLIDAARYIWYWSYRRATIEALINESVKEYR